MPPEAGAPDDPREWLNRAQSNLERARADSNLPNVYLEDLCFDAQQSAEKALKALLIHLEVVFPFVHDLAALLTLVEASGAKVPEGVQDAGRLTRFAVAARYPGPEEPVDEQEYLRAVAIAEAVVEWVRGQIGRA
ncbi:MAG: HEPN domain-containing protein [Acidobacteria bacterium]|nr:HEPN domain-containing protein [Acidobacteriota bacterium]